MSKKKSKYILLSVIVTLVVVGAYALGQNKSGQENLLPGRLELAETHHNFGTIGLDKVHYPFKIKNTGPGPLTIEKVSTSCMCTSAQLKKGDKTSPSFGMDHGNLPKANLTLAPSEEAEVIVTYNPLAHGLSQAAGYFRRVVYLKTSNPKDEYEITIEMTVDPDLQLKSTGVETFDFAETEYDFGLIKQSGGVVQHEFPFTYHGTSTVQVTGVPTSCACTSAEIDKQELNPGDKGVITVSFDPNLHHEPDGKFFKTINLLTKPALENTPELKIWAEINLDLGPDAYKLKGHDDE